MDLPAALLDYVRATYDPLGIVVSGSIVRGEAGPNSDWDVFVVHAQRWRLREQRRFDGVPAELFVNPAPAIRRYFRSEHAAARPSTAHLLSTGIIAGPADPVVHALVAEAHDWMARPLDPIDLVALRYHAVDLLDDARDVRGDPAELLLLGQVVERVVEHAFRSRALFLPRRKTTIAALEAIDAHAASLVRAFTCASPADRLAIVEVLARHALGVDAFFEWTSARDPA